MTRIRAPGHRRGAALTWALVGTGAAVAAVVAFVAAAPPPHVESLWPTSVAGWLTCITVAAAVVRELYRGYRHTQEPTEKRFAALEARLRAQRHARRRLERHFTAQLIAMQRVVARLEAACPEWDGATERRFHGRRREDAGDDRRHPDPD